MSFDERAAARVRRLLGSRRGIEERRMFGGLSFLSRGRMFLGVIGQDLMVRIGKAKDHDALEDPHVRPMDFTGRPLRGFVFVSPKGYAKDDDLEKWIALALEYVASLPARTEKSRA